MTSKIQVVSYSELATGRDCPLKHHLAYRQRWAKQPEPGSPRDIGTTWHLALQAHYESLMATQDLQGTMSDEERLLLAAEAVGAILNSGHPEPQSEVQELADWMYAGYVNHYGVDPNWRILAVEYAPVVPLLNEAGRPTRFRLKAKIDLVVQDLFTRTIDLVDHKGNQNLKRDKEVDLDDQFGLYTWMMRQLGKKVQKSIYSGARTQRNKTVVQTLDSRFKRTPMFRTDAELTNLALDAWRAAVALYRKEVPYSAPDPNQCGWKCDFRDAHLLMRKGVASPQVILTDLGFTQDWTRH